MHQNKQAYGERYECRADSGHGGVFGRDSDNHWIFGRDSDAPRVLGRDSDAQRGENGEMMPDNHLSVQNLPEDIAMSGTRPKTPPRPGPAMERPPPETRQECNPTTKNITAPVRDPSNVLQ